MIDTLDDHVGVMPLDPPNTLQRVTTERGAAGDTSSSSNGWPCNLTVTTELGTAEDTPQSPTSPGRPPESEVLAEFGPFVEKRRQSLLNAFTEKIASDIAEIREEGGPLPQPDLQECARTLARQIIPRIVLAKQLGWGAFVNDDGSISIVLQSMITDRRVTFRIFGDGHQVETIWIDEHMSCESSRNSAEDFEQPRRLASWVTKRA